MKFHRWYKKQKTKEFLKIPKWEKEKLLHNGKKTIKNKLEIKEKIIKIKNKTRKRIELQKTFDKK